MNEMSFGDKTIVFEVLDNGGVKVSFKWIKKVYTLSNIQRKMLILTLEEHDAQT